jgi:hypothetical protein
MRIKILFILMLLLTLPAINSFATDSLDQEFFSTISITSSFAGSMETPTYPVADKMKKIGYIGIFTMAGSAGLSTVGVIMLIPMWSGVTYSTGLLAFSTAVAMSFAVFFPVGVVMSIVGFSLMVQHIKYNRRNERAATGVKSPVRISLGIRLSPTR